MKSRVVLYYLLPLLLLVLLVGVNLWYGSVSLPPAEVWQALCGNLPADSTAHLIVCELRLPTLLTAALVGAALAVSGLLMQTVFSNPLADPSVLGVNAGAALGAATALLCMGGALGAAAGSWGGWLTVAGAAAMGAAAVMALLMACAVVVRNHLMLLVVGCTFVLQVLIIQFAGAFFGTVPLGIAMWGKLFALAFSVIVLSEVIKVFARLFQKKKA